MHKKYQYVLLSCALAAALLSGCAGGHTHEASDTWEVDCDRHWRPCTECGKAMEESAHTLDDAYTCTVCGAQIIELDEGKSLSLFNENGDPLKLADYDADGNLITETVYTYEYDADGVLIRSTATTDGVLTEESTYTAENGESVLKQNVSYTDDGSKTVNDYDENGNCVHMVCYEKDGSVSFESTSEYALTADGEWYESKCTETQADGSKTVSTFAENHDQLSATFYEADGSVLYKYTWERTYDENGNWKTMKHYSDGVLITDTVFATVTTEDGSVTYPQTVTEYAEDGSRTVTVYDENENVLSETHYDANGNKVA